MHYTRVYYWVSSWWANRIGLASLNLIIDYFKSFYFNVKFSLFPAHINISYNNDNVYIMCRKRGGQKIVLMNVRPQTMSFNNKSPEQLCDCVLFSAN